jgi:hypothetical protein
MKKCRAIALLSVAFSYTALADIVPYANKGTVAPTNTFTAIATGDIVAFFDGSSASDTDYVTLFVNGVQEGSGGPNKGDSIAASFDLGSATAGDVLVFDLNNVTTGQIFSSDPADSADGISHVYATAFSGSASPSVPAGVYLGFEDLSRPSSDLDYNDDSLVVTNVTAALVRGPEPRSFAPDVVQVAEPEAIFLLGSVVAALALLHRRTGSMTA